SKETGDFVFNPTNDERDASDLDLIVAGTANSVVMVEAGANEVAEAIIVEALVKAQEQFSSICAEITKIAKEIGKTKVELVSEDEVAKSNKIDELAQLLL